MAYPDARAFHERDAGETADQITASGEDRLVRPERPRNRGEDRFPHCGPPCELFRPERQITNGRADERVLVQTVVDALEVVDVGEVEQLEVGEGIRHLSEAHTVGLLSPDDGPQCLAVSHVGDVHRQRHVADDGPPSDDPPAWPVDAGDKREDGQHRGEAIAQKALHHDRHER